MTPKNGLAYTNVSITIHDMQKQIYVHAEVKITQVWLPCKDRYFCLEETAYFPGPAKPP